MKANQFQLNLNMDADEFIEVDGHLYACKDTIKRETNQLHPISEECLKLLKEFEGKLTQKIIHEWLTLTRALDQSCSYEDQWDDRIILHELIEGRRHSIAWYADHCKSS